MPQICLYLTGGAPWRQKKVLQIGQNGPNQTPIFKTPRKVVKVFSQSAKFHPHFRICDITKNSSNQIFERISKKLHKKSVKSFYINRLHRPSWKFRNIFSQFSLENSVKSTFLLLNRCFHEIFMSGESKFLIFRFGFTKKKLLRFSLK